MSLRSRPISLGRSPTSVRVAISARVAATRVQFVCFASQAVAPERATRRKRPERPEFSAHLDPERPNSTRICDVRPPRLDATACLSVLPQLATASPRWPRLVSLPAGFPADSTCPRDPLGEHGRAQAKLAENAIHAGRVAFRKVVPLRPRSFRDPDLHAPAIPEAGGLKARFTTLR